MNRFKNKNSKIILIVLIGVGFFTLFLLFYKNKKDTTHNKVNDENFEAKIKKFKLIETKYGHPVDPDYSPMPTKGATPRFSQLDLLGGYDVDSSTYEQNKNTIKIYNNITDIQYSQIGNNLMWYKTRILGDGSTKYQKNVRKLQEINQDFIDQNSDFKYKIFKNNQTTFPFEIDTNPKILDSQLVGLFFQDSPVIFNSETSGGVLRKNEDNIIFEYYLQIIQNPVGSKINAKDISKLYANLNELKFKIFLVKDNFREGENLVNDYQGEIFQKINFKQIYLAYVPQTTALLPYFVVCGDAYEEVEAKTNRYYICALTEAIDYGD